MTRPDAETWQLVQRLRRVARERPERIQTPGPGQESVWDYPRPPRVEPEGRRVRVLLADEPIADTLRALRVLETAGPPTYYVPPEDVRRELLEPEGRASLCEWKGHACHWSLRMGSLRMPGAAWSYPDPLPGYESIRAYFAFYPKQLDCFLGDWRATPQPGPYYGGWVTPQVVGPFKGDPGSERW